MEQWMKPAGMVAMEFACGGQEDAEMVGTGVSYGFGVKDVGKRGLTSLKVEGDVEENWAGGCSEYSVQCGESIFG